MTELQISAADVKKLREMTGSGMMECKKALTESGGDVEKAIEILRKAGLKTAEKRAGRETREGRVASYIHHNNRVGVLIEVNCETDFVAKTDEFKAFVQDICMQIAAARPLYVKREDVPADVIEKEKSFYVDEVKGKPENIQEKIIAGKLDKWFAERCLVEQPFVKDDSKTVGDLLKALIGKTGENMSIARFTCYELGG